MPVADIIGRWVEGKPSVTCGSLLPNASGALRRNTEAFHSNKEEVIDYAVAGDVCEEVMKGDDEEADGW